MSSAPTDTTMPLKDTQNEPDDRHIAIDRVGVRALRYPMQVQIGRAHV